jgi:hypothetical protein
MWYYHWVNKLTVLQIYNIIINQYICYLLYSLNLALGNSEMIYRMQCLTSPPTKPLSGWVPLWIYHILKLFKYMNGCAPGLPYFYRYLTLHFCFSLYIKILLPFYLRCNVFLKLFILSRGIGTKTLSWH